MLDDLRNGARPTSAELVAVVAAATGLPTAAVHGAATFFADLRQRAARHVRVCTGTRCFAAVGSDPLSRTI